MEQQPPQPTSQPPAPQPAAPQNPSNIASPYRNNKIKPILLTVGIVFCILLFFIVVAITMTVYSNIKLPLLSNHKKDLTLIYYKIPFIPKNPEQILLTAVDKNTRLKTYNTDFSLTAQLRSTDVEIASIDLQVNGPIDISDEKNPAFSVDGKASVNFGGHAYELDGKLLEKGKVIYAKIDKLPPEVMNFYGNAYSIAAAQTPQEEIKKNFEELFKNWIKYEFKSLPTQARAELDKNIENTSVTNKIREQSEDFLLKSSILPEVKKLKDEKIDNVDTYHLLLDPPKDKVQKIVTQYLQQDKDLQKAQNSQQTIEAIASSFEKLHLEVWVGKGDAIIRKTSLQTEMDLGQILKSWYPTPTYPNSTTSTLRVQQPSTQYPSTYTPNYFGLGDLGKAKLAFSTVVSLNDVNKPVKITPPDKTVTVEQYMKLFQDAFLTKEAKAQKDKQAQQNSDMMTLNNALTMYFVDTTHYPVTLNEMVGKYIKTGDPVISRLDTYRFRRNAAGNKFVLYVLVMGKYDSSYSTPYFGFTNNYNYPHQLTLSEFSEAAQ